ncbi:hypothetical protein C8R47DRAFT_976306 [Mycena vitilis]|nr:hypothetical protein C8R47DRAFT_976306 [Mycena vitilis]
MLKTAKNFDLEFDALALGKDIKEELPIFFHLGGNADFPRHNNSSCAKCLRDNHRVRDARDILDILERNYDRHSRRRNCACIPCKSDRRAGCDTPYKCHEEGIKLLDCLDEKWDPRQAVRQSNKDLTEDERKSNSQAITDKEPVVFDPRIALEGPLTEGFRIFCSEVSGTPAHQIDPLEDEDAPSEVTVFIGNSEHVNEDGEYCSSGAVWYGLDDIRNEPVRVREELASKHAGEAAAILYAIQNLPRETSPHFVVRSRRILKALTTDLEACEDKEWLEISDSTLLKAITAALRGRGSRCILQDSSRRLDHSARGTCGQWGEASEKYEHVAVRVLGA